MAEGERNRNLGLAAPLVFKTRSASPAESPSIFNLTGRIVPWGRGGYSQTLLCYDLMIPALGQR